MPEVTRQYLKQRIDAPERHPFYQEWGQHDRVFLAATRHFQTVPLPSLTSVRQVLGGRYRHWLDHHPFSLDTGSCLVTGPGRSYAIEIDSPRPVTTVEIHHSHATAEATLHDLNCRRLEQALDPDPVRPRDLFDQVYRQDEALSRQMGAIVRHLGDGFGLDRLWLDEAIRELLACAVRHQAASRPLWDRLQAVRPGTRQELFRRLLRARDAMEGDLGAPHRIADLATVAHLSPFHFQRLFRQVFGAPVSAWLAERRLQHARHLVAGGRRELTEIAAEVGFAHLSSFSRAYRRRFGHPPTADRRSIRTLG